MTEESGVKASFLDDFKNMGWKQWLGIVASLALSLSFMYMGLYNVCAGFLIVAIVLYMVPHFMGVRSVKVKATLGAVFVIAAMLMGVFACSGTFHNVIDDDIGFISISNPAVTYAYYDYDTGTLEFTVNTDLYYEVYAYSSTVKAVSFGYPVQVAELTELPVSELGKDYVVVAEPVQHSIFYVGAKLVDADGKSISVIQVFRNYGMSEGDINQLSLVGSGYNTALVALLFFVILIFSALMRRGADKARAQMEADGRLYPKGYDKCKECGSMVLPGEVTCRKCGAAIDIPEELRPKKKDFFECSECGTEVPMDAKFCPKCGANFDDIVETEITHKDGTVDTSTEVFECSECGKQVPANAERCPYCGARFDEEDE